MTREPEPTARHAGVDHDDSERCRPGGHHSESFAVSGGRQDVTGDVLVVGRDPVGAHGMVSADQDQVTAGGRCGLSAATLGAHPAGP